LGVSYVKFCPRCQTTTGVDSALCPNCGHQFRTHFQPPISEKTIAMTSVSEADRQRNLDDLEADEADRPLFRPRLILLAAVVLAILGLVYGVLTRHAHEAGVSGEHLSAPTQAFRPYPVTVTGVTGGAAPVATRSIADLKQWDASQTPPTKTGETTAEDSPLHVGLYTSRRILLVTAGTSARVLSEQGDWRRILILSGPNADKQGFISRDHLERTPAPSSQPQ
jgi:hypothetical protein